MSAPNAPPTMARSHSSLSVPEHDAPAADTTAAAELRMLSRSPHPYHHQNAELPHPAERLLLRPRRRTTSSSARSGTTSAPASPKLDGKTTSFPAFAKESSPGSESGTDADDEHFLKGLPAPRTRLHKGLRGRSYEALSGASTPLLSPAILQEEGRSDGRSKPAAAACAPAGWYHPEGFRRSKVLVRRSMECAIVGGLGAMLWTNQEVRPVIVTWSRELKGLFILFSSLILLYIPRLALWNLRHRGLGKWWALSFPTSFDPAPALYPPSITIFVTLLLATGNPQIIIPNIILSVCSLPTSLIPSSGIYDTFNPLHWAFSCLPLRYTNMVISSADITTTLTPEHLTLLYPLNQSLCQVLQDLTTTSLEPAELQLLSIALINLLLFSRSPQMVILKALLWGGGLGLMILCGAVIRWGISLARVPKWRFRRTPPQAKTPTFLETLRSSFSLRKMKREILFPLMEASDSESFSSDLDVVTTGHKPVRVQTFDVDGTSPRRFGSRPISPIDEADDTADSLESAGRRATFPTSKTPRKSRTHTASGRRRRAMSSTVRSFFKLTYAQATTRKWLYAVYVYVCILAIGLVGLREYIGRRALGNHEPVGWALGYLFGDLPWFRFNVVSHNLERWICLPPRGVVDADGGLCRAGWVEHVRHADFGAANTRLFLLAYWLLVLAFGLVVVVTLSPRYEVDTRRKVFHFMMVAMLLPGTFVDPAYAALALAIVLAAFLVLDLLRASQLPPLSRPLASFLAPYVDGRDFRGPVVVSHIFLLIGCAIPLWLTLAALPRVPTPNKDDALAGWDVATREVSMVAGVVCVGLGDAAASLIGRRWGHRKWFWGGGKSLEGSVAFAAAVSLGLLTTRVWLGIGGWPETTGTSSWPGAARNAGVCAATASLTEAVLTGGNDNVIVPVVLWACVKSLGV